MLDPLRRRLPELRIVLEHITTMEAAQYVAAGGSNLAATITAHHLVINRNAIFAGGIRPHLYCLPIAKRERHRLALRRAAVSGDPHFFLGTDSAPHARTAKETACGCAGIFTAPCALEIYAEMFEEEGALDRLEAFAALNGPAFYRLPPNEARITLRREPCHNPRAHRRRRQCGCPVPRRRNPALAPRGLGQIPIILNRLSRESGNPGRDRAAALDPRLRGGDGRGGST